MAQRRMLSLKVIDTDLFLDMPNSSQLLYFHLSMRADDDGFISSPKKIMKIVGCSDDDMRILVSKRFIIPFDTGICVITHWRIHNYIQKDRYTETIYKEEKKLLNEQHGTYCKLLPEQQLLEMYPECIQTVSSLDTQGRVGKSKVSIGKVNKEKEASVIFQGFQSANHERDYSVEYELHKKYWNSLSLPECRKSAINISNWGEILNSMQLYTLEEITAAINNYSSLHKREKAITYSTFPNFLIKGIEKYADSSKPYDTFKETEEEKKSSSTKSSRYVSDNPLTDEEQKKGEEILEKSGGLDAMFRDTINK